MNDESSLVGWYSSNEEAIQMVALLAKAGIKCEARPSGSTATNYYRNHYPDYDCHSVWCVDGQAGRAREFRRGFKAGLNIRGNPDAFFVGAVFALKLKFGQRRKMLNNVLNVFQKKLKAAA